MARGDAVTLYEFIVIKNELRKISQTWADLWAVLYYTKRKVGDVISLTYSFYLQDELSDNKSWRFKFDGMHQEVREIILRRYFMYPGDKYIFQSHSNRMKNREKPVTVIAFNAALRRVSINVTDKKVTSHSAIRIIR